MKIWLGLIRVQNPDLSPSRQLPGHQLEIRYNYILFFLTWTMKTFSKHNIWIISLLAINNKQFIELKQLNEFSGWMLLNHPFDVRAWSLYQKQFFTSSHPKVEYHPYLTIYRNIILDFKLFINFFTYNIIEIFIDMYYYH